MSDVPSTVMGATLRGTVTTTLPPNDRHPYRSGAWRPNHREWDADDLEVQGELPADLSGVYLRNTENPRPRVDRALPPLRRRRDAPPDRLPRRHASYRNRFVRTDSAGTHSCWVGTANR